MNNQAEVTALPRWMGSWERFWFTPMDPTLLALIRIACGMITLYTFVIYCFILPETMGKDAWVDLELRDQLVHDRPIVVTPLGGAKPLVPPQNAAQSDSLKRYKDRYGMDLRAFGLVPPETPWEWEYLVEYTEKWQQPPPAYAASKGEAKKVNDYIEAFSKLGFLVDPRISGLRMPENEWEESYLKAYMTHWHVPPPSYAKDEAEAATIQAFMLQEGGIDPRYLYTRGMPVWSIWMHVTDPRWTAWVQAAFVLSALLFTLGLGSRVTAALTWFASLNYLHRNPQVMFGADTMINILLIYLTIGPSSAVLSLDRVVKRWWRGTTAPPEPSVSANLAVRLLQIHVCIIYFVAGIAKLQGVAWWNGTALWNVIANFEFAPMQFSIYNDILRFFARDQLRLEILTTGGSYFTLAFEIGYCFLIWWPRTRWVWLGAAILLHGMIGMFMGLKTFSMVMLVMNMAFLRPEEARWMLGLWRWPKAQPPVPAPQLETVASAAK
jgi:hypothetical protein